MLVSIHVEYWNLVLDFVPNKSLEMVEKIPIVISVGIGVPKENDAPGRVLSNEEFEPVELFGKSRTPFGLVVIRDSTHNVKSNE